MLMCGYWALGRAVSLNYSRFTVGHPLLLPDNNVQECQECPVPGPWAGVGLTYQHPFHCWTMHSYVTEMSIIVSYEALTGAIP